MALNYMAIDFRYLFPNSKQERVSGEKKKNGGDTKGGLKQRMDKGWFQAIERKRADQMEKREHVEFRNTEKRDELVTEKKRRRINGHLDNEILWQLGKRLVGTMGIVCSAETVRDRLHSWGLGDIKVKSLGGQKFLLQIEDEELLQMLEENNWSLLEEVFTKFSLELLEAPFAKEEIKEVVWCCKDGFSTYLIKNCRESIKEDENYIENAFHLFAGCPFTKKFWVLFSSWWNSITCSYSTIEVLFQRPYGAFGLQGTIGFLEEAL
ncbi:hypothetical protein GQ457_14G023890 [Hibiscus cannabinus]